MNEIHLFVKVVQSGSFSRAAQALATPKSTVSTKVANLERRLGVALLTRTTRKLRLTEIGRNYYERCVRSLEAIEQAGAEASRSQNTPMGRLRVTAPIELGHIHLTPLIDRFARENPGIQLEFLLTDEVLDLVADGVDLAIRAGDLDDSSLRARKLGESVFRLFAAPKYLKRSGIPKSVSDLEKHRRLHFSSFSAQGEWNLRKGAERKRVGAEGSILSNHLIQLKDLALEGAGIVLMPAFLGVEEVHRGHLIPLLPEWHGEKSAVHVVHPRLAFTPPKVERFISYLRENFRLPEV